MDIQLVGTIINILPVVSGTSAKGEWVKQEYVLSIENEQYPRSVCFQIFGQDKINAIGLQINERVRVHLDISTNEYNGRFYNTISCWKVDRNELQGSQVVTPNPQQVAQPTAQQQFPPKVNSQGSPQQQTATSVQSQDSDLPF